MSSKPIRTAQRFVLGFNDGTLGLLAVAVLLFGAAAWSAHSPNVEKTDFSLTYVGAKIQHEGMGHSLYDVTLQKRVRDSLFQHPSPLFFEHPPFEALLFAPLAALPFRTAYGIWAAFNAAVWLWLIIGLRKYLSWPGDSLGYLFFWLLFAPLWVALYQGQSSILLLAFYSVTFAALRLERDALAGLALGLGLFKLQFVLPFVLIFIFRRKWRFLLGFGVSSVLLALLSFLAVGWKGVFTYVRFLLAIGSNPQNESYGSAVDMPTLHGMVYAILGHVVSRNALNVVVAMMAVAVLGFVAWRWENLSTRQSFALLFAAAIAAALVTGSHMFTHDFSPLILALFVAGMRLSAPEVKSSTPVRYVMIASLFLFWTFPVYFLFVAWHCMFLMCPILLLFTWAALSMAQTMETPAEHNLQSVELG